jgi:hypothetical protein
MIFDKYGLVKDNGASDWADSARLAGIMALLGHESAPICGKYFVGGKPVRHPYATQYPENEPRCMSRDQLVCLMAGLYNQQDYFNRWKMAGKWFAPNNMNEQTKKWKVPDIFTPSVRNHFKLCANKEGSWLGYMWLRLDIWYNAKFTPLREPNQLLAMCVVAGPKYVRLYKASCDWKKAIRLYWAESYRDEKEFAEFLIAKLERFGRIE